MKNWQILEKKMAWKDNIVIDSCVFIKLLVEETDSVDAVDFLTAVVRNNVKIIVPHLFFMK